MFNKKATKYFYENKDYSAPFPAYRTLSEMPPSIHVTSGPIPSQESHDKDVASGPERSGIRARINHQHTIVDMTEGKPVGQASPLL